MKTNIFLIISILIVQYSFTAKTKCENCVLAPESIPLENKAQVEAERMFLEQGATSNLENPQNTNLNFNSESQEQSSTYENFYSDSPVEYPSFLQLTQNEDEKPLSPVTATTLLQKNKDTTY